MLNEHVEAGVREREKTVAKFMREEIETIDSRIETRGIGLLWGVDFGKFEGDISKKVLDEAFRNGLIVERVGRGNAVIKVMPALNVPGGNAGKGPAHPGGRDPHGARRRIKRFIGPGSLRACRPFPYLRDCAFRAEMV